MIYDSPFEKFYSYRIFVTLLKRLNGDIQLQVVLYFFVVATGGTSGYDDIIVTKQTDSV